MKKPDDLTIISPHWEGITKSFDLAFKNWYKQIGNAVPPLLGKAMIEYLAVNI